MSCNYLKQTFFWAVLPSNMFLVILMNLIFALRVTFIVLKIYSDIGPLYHDVISLI